MANGQFVKITARGAAQGQELNTSFYYARDDEGVIDFVETELLSLLVQFDQAFRAPYAAGIANDATYHTLTATLINEKNETASPYEVTWDIDWAGNITGGLSGVAHAAVIAFQCEAYKTDQPYRVPKGSYIVYGPIGEGYVQDDQTLTVTMLSFVFDVQTALQTTLTTASSMEYVPCRVGVESKISHLGSAGRIVTTIARPCSTFRRSRMRSPKGV